MEGQDQVATDRALAAQIMEGVNEYATADVAKKKQKAAPVATNLFADAPQPSKGGRKKTKKGRKRKCKTKSRRKRKCKTKSRRKRNRKGKKM